MDKGVDEAEQDAGSPQGQHEFDVRDEIHSHSVRRSERGEDAPEHSDRPERDDEREDVQHDRVHRLRQPIAVSIPRLNNPVPATASRRVRNPSVGST